MVGLYTLFFIKQFL